VICDLPNDNEHWKSNIPAYDQKRAPDRFFLKKLYRNLPNLIVIQIEIINTCESTNTKYE